MKFGGIEYFFLEILPFAIKISEKQNLFTIVLKIILLQYWRRISGIKTFFYTNLYSTNFYSTNFFLCHPFARLVLAQFEEIIGSKNTRSRWDIRSYAHCLWLSTSYLVKKISKQWSYAWTSSIDSFTYSFLSYWFIDGSRDGGGNRGCTFCRR